MKRLGIDIGGTSVKAAVLADDAVSATGRSLRYRRPSLERLLDAVEEAALKVLDDRVRIDRIGICVPGVFDEASGQITASINIPSLEGVRVEDFFSRPLLSRLRGIPVTVVSDAHAAAHDCWALEGMEGRLLAISLGAGVGACVLDGGMPLRVSGRSSGHFGQIDVTINEGRRRPPVGPDGGRGGLEAYVGAAALAARYGRGFTARLGTLGAKDVPLVALARAIRIGHAIYRPQHVRLLGGTGLALAPALGVLRGEIEAGLTRLARSGWSLAAGTTAFHAACGAARLAESGR